MTGILLKINFHFSREIKSCDDSCLKRERERVCEYREKEATISLKRTSIYTSMTYRFTRSSFFFLRVNLRRTYFLIITRIGLSIKNIPAIGKFPSLLSAERSPEATRGSKMLASGMITSTVDALKRRGRFQDERRRSSPGSPSTSSRANPCIMERSNRGHRSSEGALLASPRRVTPHPHPHHRHHHRRAVSILPSL